jgi:hypothetical protein
MLKEICLTIAVAFGSWGTVFSQDTVFTVSGQVLPCTVIGQDSTEVTCRTLDTSITETFTIAKSEISRIIYFKDAQTIAREGVVPADSFRMDTIYTADKNKIIGKVVELDADYVVYITADSSNAEHHILTLAATDRIHFAVGTVDYLLDMKPAMSRDEYYRLGLNDAMIYYNYKKDFRKGMLCGAMTYVFYAGVVMIIVEHRRLPVLQSNPSNPNDDLLLTNSDYQQGYLHVAGSKRKKKLIQGYVVGLVAAPAVFIVGSVAILIMAYSMQ